VRVLETLSWPAVGEIGLVTKCCAQGTNGVFERVIKAQRTEWDEFRRHLSTWE
jgi:hypothetical protein